MTYDNRHRDTMGSHSDTFHIIIVGGGIAGLAAVRCTFALVFVSPLSY